MTIFKVQIHPCCNRMLIVLKKKKSPVHSLSKSNSPRTGKSSGFSEVSFELLSNSSSSRTTSQTTLATFQHCFNIVFLIIFMLVSDNLQDPTTPVGVRSSVRNRWLRLGCCPQTPPWMPWVLCGMAFPARRRPEGKITQGSKTYYSSF